LLYCFRPCFTRGFLFRFYQTDLAMLFSEPLADFGPNRLNPWTDAASVYRIEGRRAAQFRARLCQECPRRPGVYGMIDAEGKLIYVGKAKSLRARLLSYCRSKGRALKAGRILRETRSILWEYVPSDFAALLRELELIRRWRPAFNFQGQPRRYWRTLLCLGRRPAPYLYLSRRPSTEIVGAWGPVFVGRRTREAVRRLNDYFGLRDCPQPQPMIFAEQANLFPLPLAAGCIRHEIGTCLGPCAGACTRLAYADRVRAARTFLDGNDLTPLEKLQRDMNTAAAEQAYERAALLREKLTALDWLNRHLERVRQASERHHFIYPVKGHGGMDLWYLIRQGWVACAIAKPRDDDSRKKAVTAIDAVFQQPPPKQLRPPAEEIDSVFLVSAWFRRYPKELKRTLTPVEALAQAE
jgi:excinuclease ABC subunit C